MTFPKAPGVVDEPAEDWVKRDVIVKSRNIKKIPPRYSFDHSTYSYEWIRYELVGAVYDSGNVSKIKAFYKSRGLNVNFRKMGGKRFTSYHLVYVSDGKWREGHTSSRSMIP